MARPSHLVFVGGAGHQQHEDVASPGGVLGVEPTGEQNAEQVLGEEKDRFGCGWVTECQGGDPGMVDQGLTHALEE